MKTLWFAALLTGLVTFAAPLWAQTPAAKPTPAAPALRYRWLYLSPNLQVDEEVPRVEAILKRAKAVGYNGAVLADYKLHILDRVPERYFANLARVKKTADNLGIKLYPTVLPFGYSNGLLAHDPNLAEGLPVKNASFVVRGRTADIAPPSSPLLPNGGFEAVNGTGKFANWNFVDGEGIAASPDTNEKHGGMQSLRFERPAGSEPTNLRVMREVTVEPFRQMHLSVWIKTKDYESHGQVQTTILPFDDTPEDKARGEAPSLVYNTWTVQRTQDWTEYHAVFNTLNHRKIGVYVGTWGARGGTLWLDDLKLEPVGLLNVLRRAACPLKVTGANGTTYAEGRDFEKVFDPRMGNVPYAGNYEVYHAAPTIHLTPDSRIRDGETLRVSYYHPVLIYGDQVCASLSDSAALAVARGMTARVEKALAPPGYFLSHDEIRVAGWGEEPGTSGKTSGQLLGQNFAASTRMIKEIAKGRTPEQFTWSDMFDPHHNARPRYYLARGGMTNSWKGLPPSIVVVNWNSEKPKESLGFFAGRGNRQILAGYYDGSPNSIKGWLETARALPNNGRVIGAMYTTWQNRYDDLEAFARAAWGEVLPKALSR